MAKICQFVGADILVKMMKMTRMTMMAKPDDKDEDEGGDNRPEDKDTGKGGRRPAIGM